MDVIFGSTPKTRDNSGAIDAGICTNEDIATVTRNNVNFPTYGTQKSKPVILFNMHIDVEWSVEGEGEPNTPPRSISHGIAIHEETQSENPSGVRAQSMKKNQKRLLSNSPTKGVAGAIKKFSEMYVMLERERQLKEISTCLNLRKRCSTTWLNYLCIDH